MLAPELVAVHADAALLGISSDFSVPLLRVDPRWAPLRGHPRFRRLVCGREGAGPP